MQSPSALLCTVIAVLLCAGLAAPAASAEIYRWTDSQGRLHFSQDIEKVPKAERARARREAKRQRVHDPLQVYQSGASSGGSAPAARAGGSQRTMRIPFERHGTLMRVEVLLNGRVRAPFFIDTGASGVSLPSVYAKRLGIQIGPDTPRVHVQTANGIIATPLVRLDSVKLGGAQVDGLMATVNPTTNIGLLGGTFFNNFNYGVDPSSNVITLTRNHAVQTGLGEDHWRRRFNDIRGPLEQLKRYLVRSEISRKGRREELRQRQASLEAKLEALVLEANRVDVPAGWRR